jgi:hypothetical protein
MRASTIDVTGRKTYDLIAEPSGSDYGALIDGALVQCDTAIVRVPGGDHSPALAAVLDRLLPFHQGEPIPQSGGTLHRYRLDRISAPVFQTVVDSLYGWCPPEAPADLCVLRTDGSPWLVSIAAQRLGYLELTPFEKLLLGRGSPTLARVLAHQGATDAVLAVLERSFESSVDELQSGISIYAQSVVADSRDGLVEAIRDWLESDDQARMSVAIEIAGQLGLEELTDDIAGMREAVLGDVELAPHVYGRNEVLRDRWRARYIRQLDKVLEALGHVPSPVPAHDGDSAPAGGP